jgi:hypothetical protein
MDHVFRGRVSAGVGWGARAFSGGGSPTKRLRLAAEGRPAAQRGMGRPEKALAGEGGGTPPCPSLAGRRAKTALPPVALAPGRWAQMFALAA